MSYVATFVKGWGKRVAIAALGPLLLVLSACGTLPNAEPESVRYDYVTTLEITERDSVAELEARYRGSVVVWRPEAGFAIMGLHAIPGSLVVQNMSANRNVILAPIRAQGFTAWAGGFTAWSGGYTAWSGGSTTETTFSENMSLWSQIRLEGAQRRAFSLGQGVKVAVIDTGVDLDHPAFQGKLAPTSDWRDFVDGDTNPHDQNSATGSNDGYGHGTAVAGVILQVAPKAVILPIRVLRPDGSGDVTSVISAIDWAIQRGARVINLSLGTATSNAALAEMIRYAVSKNVVVVSSAGNSGDSSVTYPAADSMTNQSGGKASLGVGSVNSHDVKSTFSTYGSNLEMVAPGEKVYTPFPGQMVVSATGTSFAAPMVTGAAALALGQNAGLSASYVESGISSTLSSVSSLNPHYSLGGGRLNVEAALAWMGF